MSATLDRFADYARSMGLEAIPEHIDERQDALAIKKPDHHAGETYLYVIATRGTYTRGTTHTALVMGHGPRGAKKVSLKNARTWIAVLAPMVEHGR